MPKPKRSLTKAREARAWELSVRCKTTRQIAAILIEEGLGPITQQAVSLMLVRVGQRETAKLTEEVSAYKAKQAKLLEFLASESLDAWDRSMNPATERRVETVTIKARHGADQVDLPAKKVTRTTRWRDGDPRFLAEARAAAADIRRMLGLDALPTDPPAGQGAPDPEAARRALSAAVGEPSPVTDDEDDHPEAEEIET